MGYIDLINALKNNENVVSVCRNFYENTHNALPKCIYKYYSLNKDVKLNNSKIECLKDRKIYLSCSAEFNDPYDDKGYMYRKEVVENYAKQQDIRWTLTDMYPDFKRVTCFTQTGIGNMPMWAHYANNHQGYCVEYREYNNLKLYSLLLPVEYIKRKIDLTDMICSRLEMVRKHGNPKLLEDAMEWCSIFLSCVKHESWESEKELRFCCRQDYPGVPYFEALPSKIYVGSMCSKEYEDRLNQIGKNLNIPVYRMQLDVQESEYILRPHELL